MADPREFHEFDHETGEELESSIKRSLEVEDSIAIQEGEDLSSLRNAAGYKVFEKFLSENIEYWGDKLLKARRLDTVIRCQEIIKSYVALQSWMEQKIQVSRDIKEKLQTEKDSQ